MGKWTRRAFITTGSLVGGGLLLGVAGVVLAPNRLGVRDRTRAGSAALTTWVKITPDSEIIALIPHCEMGQGAQTGLAMMLAEELEADWADVRVEEAPAESVYANGHFIAGMLQQFVDVPVWLNRPLEYAAYRASRIVPLMVTGGSSSTTATGQFGMRVAGAAAKVMLLQAAADLWSVPVEECHAENTHVLHRGSGRKARFGDLAKAAAQLEPPVHPPLKAQADYTLVGHSRPRPDLPAKVSGQAVYAVDVQRPGMLYATVAAAPVPGDLLQSVDHAPALAVPGVRQVVELENAVAVVASGYWQALQGLRSLQPVFSSGGRGDVSTDSLFAAHARALDAGDGSNDLKSGSGAAALSSAQQIIEAEYRLPYLAHATMEPMSATAQVETDRCEVWTGVQDPLNARKAAAEAAGLRTEQVTLHNQQIGGGFGRRLPFSFDYVDQAVRIAAFMSPAPVKMIWSREEDMQHDYYRPAMLARFRGGLDADGQAQCWVCDFTGSGDFGAARPVYGVPHQEITTHPAPEHLRTGSWRSVGHSQQGFLVESFVDEMAVAAGRDPYAYRRDLLAGKPRHLAVLDQVAKMAGWGEALPPGRGRGIALVESFGTVVAEVADVSVAPDGRIEVHTVWAAVDCGLVVNPDQALAQIEGGILFGLSAALYQEITLKNGAVEQRSFPDYRSLTLADAPRVVVEFLSTDSPMGGLGEPGVPPVAAAVANAVYAASGQRLRTLPLA